MLGEREEREGRPDSTGDEEGFEASDSGVDQGF